MIDKKALSIYKDKRVLVTGDTGFKGSWLSYWLRDLGAIVTGFAFPPARDNDHFNVIGLEEMINHVNGDICNMEEFQTLLNEFHPEFVFHLAAQSIVRLSYKDPKLTFNTNVCGSVNVLESIRKSSFVKVLIYVTSDKCYKNKELRRGYTEDDELGGYDPYSASKASAELAFSAYNNSFFIQNEDFAAASVRAGNVIGGGDWSPDRIIPDCIKTLQGEKQIILRNPSSTRPWQHVLEPLYGYLLLGAKLYTKSKMFSGPWNFGPDSKSNHTVKELAERVLFYWGEGSIKYGCNEGVPYEAGLLQLDSAKAYKTLNWSPKWDFDQTVAMTVEWYKKVLNGTNPLDMTKLQIEKYMEG